MSVNDDTYVSGAANSVSDVRGEAGHDDFGLGAQVTRRSVELHRGVGRQRFVGRHHAVGHNRVVGTRTVGNPTVGLRRLGLLLAGFVCLALAGVGVVLPVLPTTPLVLLAAICFERSSPRLQTALAGSRLFGPFITNYREKTGITVARKAVTLAVLWAGLTTSSFFVPHAWEIALLGVIGVGVTAHILLIKTAQPTPAPAPAN